MFKLFQRINALELMRKQVDEAQVLRAEHQAAAEHHQALATMYRDRVRRLQPEISHAEQRQQGEPGAAP